MVAFSIKAKTERKHPFSYPIAQLHSSQACEFLEEFLDIQESATLATQLVKR